MRLNELTEMIRSLGFIVVHNTQKHTRFLKLKALDRSAQLLIGNVS